MKKMLLISTILIIITIITGCETDVSLLQEQGQFSIGEDIKKFVTDDNFTQVAEGTDSTGDTIYSSSDEAVAVVNENTGEVDILSYGTSIITAANTGDNLFQPAIDSYELVVIDTKFITRWATDDVAIITIPVYNEYDYDYIIEWGDGGTSTGSSKTIIHQYETTGTYTISISGTFPGVKFYGEESSGSILSIENWGTIDWQSMKGAFYGCSNLVCNAHDVPDLSNVTDMSYMFYGARSFTSDLSSWDVSSVINMSSMFFSALFFNSDLNGWDVSNVTDISNMFYMAIIFTSDLSSWDVSNVTDMNGLFSGAIAFNSDLSTWGVTNVTDMGSMFWTATSFNSDLSTWDVSNVTVMNKMFNDATAFSNCNLGSWDVSNVTTHSDFSTNWGSGNTEPTWP